MRLFMLLLPPPLEHRVRFVILILDAPTFLFGDTDCTRCGVAPAAVAERKVERLCLLPSLLEDSFVCLDVFTEDIQRSQAVEITDLV